MTESSSHGTTPNWQRMQSDARLRQSMLTRELVYDATRSFFKSHGFHEVETPLLVSKPGTEPFLEVFETTLKTQQYPDQRAFLLTSPEYAMKKLLAGGLGSIFQITKSFRNGEGISPKHNSEFSILEWYHTPGDYTDVMDDFELWFMAIGQQLFGTSFAGEFAYQGQQYSLVAPWERLSVTQAFERYADVTTDVLLDEQQLPVAVRKMGLSTAAEMTWEEAFHLVMLNLIEPKLGQSTPSILYDYPISQAALAQPKAADPRFAERFEVFLAGMELGNAFTELRNAQEQAARFSAEIALRAQLGKTPYQMDTEYLQALQTLPRTGGIAVGMDRVVMLFADVADIRDVLTFPQAEVFDLAIK